MLGAYLFHGYRVNYIIFSGLMQEYYEDNGLPGMWSELLGRGTRSLNFHSSPGSPSGIENK